jgi:hypothetical protein
MRHIKNDLSQFNAPDGQYGIAIKGGLEFIVHEAQAQHYVYRRTPPNNNGKPGKRVLLLLDISNMFKEISRDACRLQIFTNPKFKPILPYFDLLYSSPNTCWYKDAETGKYQQFLQHEGFTQGCPMNPMNGGLAAIILSMLLKTSTTNSSTDITTTQTHLHPTQPFLSSTMSNGS